MSSFKTTLTAVALGLVVISGCKKKEEAPKEEAAKAEPAASPVSTEKTPEQKLEEEVEQLATLLEMPEDYLSAAEEEINDENLEAELAKLEKEVEAEVKESGIVLPPTPSNTVKPSGAPTLTKPPAGVSKAPTAADKH
jgi:outer membrane murein-binding lipoprotein Lpp